MCEDTFTSFSLLICLSLSVLFLVVLLFSFDTLPYFTFYFYLIVYLYFATHFPSLDMIVSSVSHPLFFLVSFLFLFLFFVFLSCPFLFFLSTFEAERHLKGGRCGSADCRFDFCSLFVANQ